MTQQEKVALKRAPTHPLRFCAEIVGSGASHGAKRSRILNLINPHDPLTTLDDPSPWYIDQAIARVEQDNVFATAGRSSGAWIKCRKREIFHGGHWG